MKLSVMYRGPLSSCNYACHYCPFAKRSENAAQLKHDKLALENFVSWIGQQDAHQWRVLFTPWGEALIRKWYQDTVIELSWLPQIDVVAIQTNLSCKLDWLKEIQTNRTSFWATYHPSEVQMAAFCSKVRRIYESGTKICVGVVAIPDNLDFIPMLRESIPAGVYLWINAQKPRLRNYTEEELGFLTSIDPYFPLTVKRHKSHNKNCHSGFTSFTVDGKGDIRRCHFVEQAIGSIYDPNWTSVLAKRNCPNSHCDCYLGFAQLENLRLDKIFGEQLLERIPIHF